jgi:putative membrane protein
MRRSCLSLLLVVSLASLGQAQLTRVDSKFVHDAAQGNRAEVMLGRLATQRGGTPSIRAFGRHMVDQHSAALAELQSLAARKHVVIPAGVKPADEALRRRLSRMTGRAFDLLYRREMIEDHQKDIREFSREARRGRDPGVRSYASKHLPHLREHLRMIRAARP